MSLAPRVHVSSAPDARERMTQPGEVRISRAVLSVSDKTGIVDFARGLAELAHHRQHVHARADLPVVRRPLVRVLAVREVGHLLEGVHEHRREVVVLLDEPARDRGVVAGRVVERLDRQALARGQREPAV